MFLGGFYKGLWKRFYKSSIKGFCTATTKMEVGGTEP